MPTYILTHSHLTMATTVKQAFAAFRTDSVDLISGQVDLARSSRDYLWTQIQDVASKNTDFPQITGKYFHYGSFARRTKVQPLDDIDMMFIIHGGKATYDRHPVKAHTYRVWVNSNDAPLAAFVGENGFVSSTKVLNKVRDKLALVHNYKKADIKKTMQAVVLNLNSHSWVFDVVPAIGANLYGTSGEPTYYLMPDGYGDWIATDPRLDSASVTTANQAAGGGLLPLMRILKFWNTYGGQTKLSSYYFESLVLKVFQNVSSISDIQSGVKYFFENAPSHLLNSFPDPKGLGPSLDRDADATIKSYVNTAMVASRQNCINAISAEGAGDHKLAIGHWQKVFGNSFPTYSA